MKNKRKNIERKKIGKENLKTKLMEFFFFWYCKCWCGH